MLSISCWIGTGLKDPWIPYRWVGVVIGGEREEFLLLDSSGIKSVSQLATGNLNSP